eukprot:1696676-Alexandrium_andersonii.AAC.1
MGSPTFTDSKPWARASRPEGLLGPQPHPCEISASSHKSLPRGCCEVSRSPQPASHAADSA